MPPWTREAIFSGFQNLHGKSRSTSPLSLSRVKEKLSSQGRKPHPKRHPHPWESRLFGGYIGNFAHTVSPTRKLRLKQVGKEKWKSETSLCPTLLLALFLRGDSSAVPWTGELCCCYWSFAKSSLILCDPMDCSTQGFPVLHRVPQGTPGMLWKSSSLLLGSHSWPGPSQKFPQFSSVQWFSCVWLFVTPWTAARQTSLSITNSLSLLKLMSIELVMPSNHLILCHPLLLPPSIFLSIRVFSSVLALRIRWPKYWSFIFSISPLMNIQGWLPVGLTGLIFLLFKELSTVFSSTTVRRPSIFWHSVLQFSQEAGRVVWYSHLLKNIPQFVVIHTVKGGALQQKLIVFKIKINTLIFQKCIFLDFLESPRLGYQPQSGQEATLRNRHGAKDWSKMGKGVCKGCILSPCLFNFYAEYIIQNARLDEAQSWSQDCQEKYQQP